MSNYVIECTVSEFTVKKTEITMKIVGSESYALKHGDKIYNIFHTKNMKKKCFIFDSETEFTGGKRFENILTQASTNGKRIRLKVSKKALKNTKDKDAIPIKSVSLLQK